MASFTMNTKVVNFKNDDEYTTPKYIWELVSKYIDKSTVLYDPFYCEGSTKKYLEELGYKNVIHNDEDFYENYSKYEYDIILTNPPFSSKQKVFKQLKEINKPFCVLVPISTIIKVYFNKLFKNQIQLILPTKRLHFEKNGKMLPNSWFDTCFICYKMDLPNDINYME